MKKLLVILLVVFSIGFVYESFFSYTYVTKEVKWNSNKLLWQVANEYVGYHEDVRAVLFRIEKDNPGAKPGDILKVKVKIRR